MPHIATINIDRKDAMETFCSYMRLYETRSDPDGPLQKIISFFREEDARHYDINLMKLGNVHDDFVVIYYCNGIRYKITKDGKAKVTGADPDDKFENANRDLQNFIDTLLNDELSKAFTKVIKENPDMSIAKTKREEDDEGISKRTLVGVVKAAQ